MIIDMRAMSGASRAIAISVGTSGQPRTSLRSQRVGRGSGQAERKQHAMTNAIIRRSGALLVGLQLFAVTAAPVAGQDGSYPARQIQVIVPFPPGGPADFFARTPFTALSAQIGRPVVFENKAGASGIIGAKAGSMPRRMDTRCSFRR